MATSEHTTYMEPRIYYQPTKFFDIQLGQIIKHRNKKSNTGKIKYRNQIH